MALAPDPHGLSMVRLLAVAAVALAASVVSAAEPFRLGVENARQPQFATAGDGKLYCAFGADYDLYCARSDDGGKTFAEPVKVATLPGLMLGLRRGPRIAATGDAVIVSAISRHEGDLVAWRSEDGGRTWSRAVRINDVARSCREGLHDMTAAPDGSIGALWLDLRNDKTELWASFSTDGGATWGENRRVYRSPGGSICECCHPTLAAGNGAWLALWRNSLNGSRDIYVASGRSDGFDDAERLGTRHWALPACPMDGGDVAIGKAGTWAVWRRDETCYATDLRRSPKSERLLGEGEQPVVAVAPAGPTFAWISGRPGDLLVLQPEETEPRKVAAAASGPSLVALPDGAVVLGWEQVEDEKSAVFVSRLGGER